MARLTNNESVTMYTRIDDCDWLKRGQSLLVKDFWVQAICCLGGGGGGEGKTKRER